MHKTWSAVVGKSKNYAWLNALGMKITSVHDTTAKVQEYKSNAMDKEEKVERGVDMVNQGQDGDDQEGEGQDGR